MIGLSTTSTSRYFPAGSIATKSPALTFRGSPPDTAIDQIVPPAAQYSTFPSGDDASELIGPLSNGIRRVILPFDTAAIAIVRRGSAPIRKAISSAPAA